MTPQWWHGWRRRRSRATAPELSVVVVSFNHAAAIGPTLLSIAGETGGAFECLVVDRLSTDRTVEFALQAVGTDPRFRIFQTRRPASESEALTAGLEMAKGSQVVFRGLADPSEGREADGSAPVYATDSLRSGMPSADSPDWPIRLDALQAAGPGTPGATAPLVFDRPADLRAVVPKDRLELPPEELAARVKGAVLIMPAVEYHVVEMGPLAEELVGRGHPVYFLVSDHRWAGIAQAVAHFDIPVLACIQPGPWVQHAAAFVTLNDWAEIYRDVILAAKEAGVPTFGKVEGVQDFDDLDVPFKRRAYQTVDHVLCQGPNDAAALGGDNAKHIVGSSRLERIRRESEPASTAALAIINLNFTYGVLEEVREAWLADAVSACDEASIPFSLSLHPQEQPAPHYRNVAEDPIRHLLTVGSVLISRFSTVPYEAMARGVPFIYFNPHEEQVPTFHEPDGAFLVARTVAELTEALHAVPGWRENYRQRSEAFFAKQIDIGERSSEVRAADIIEAEIGRARGPDSGTGRLR